MCSIVGSADREKFAELLHLNKHRGTHSHSLAVFDRRDDHMLFLERELGEFNLGLLKPFDGDNWYFLGHQQAPTTNAKDRSSIHPAFYNGTYLWHNGIIKEDHVKAWQQQYEDENAWDTHYLARYINKNRDLTKVDGTFACVEYDERNRGLYVFRNMLSPMYVDDRLNLSSTAFNNSRYLEAGEVFGLHIANLTLLPTVRPKFGTCNQFYIDLDDL